MPETEVGMGYDLGSAMYPPELIAMMTLQASCRIIQHAEWSDTLVKATFEAILGGVYTKFTVLITRVNVGYLSSHRPYKVKVQHWPDGISISEVRLGGDKAPLADADGWVRCTGLQHS